MHAIDLDLDNQSPALMRKERGLLKAVADGLCRDGCL
jgi:hypothetical protein